MGDFKQYSEEQIAAYLDGNYEIADIALLNALVQDQDLAEVLNVIEEIDCIDSVDIVDNIDNIKNIQ